jgi:hypothetical protein
MADASLVLDAIVAVSIAAGAAFAVLELRGMARDRRTHLVLDILAHVGTLEFSEQWAKIMNAEFKTAKEAEEQCSLSGLMLGASFFERVGYMARKKLVPIDIVLETMPVEYCWEKVKPWVFGEEIADPERRKYPRATYPNYEWLANEDRKRRLAAEEKAKAA